MSKNVFIGRFLGSNYDVECQLDYYLREKADRYLKEQAEKKAETGTLAEVEERKKSLKETFLHAIGGLDMERTPLNAVCVGTVAREGYEIQKIIFESRPGFYVTANLYLPPDNDEKHPGILMGCGHSDTGKAAPLYQKVCIDLARCGFVVLIIDPTGQGERRNYYDRNSGRHLIRSRTTEHSYLGLKCQLAGSNIDRYFIWDLMRAMDYLVSLPQVDPERIGMTGNSGGGGQTLRMMMLDPRVKVAAPCCYPCSHEYYLRTPLIFDGERNTHGVISRGFNDDDFYTCFAPRPVMMGAASSDYFGIEGVMRTYDRAGKIYELYGCPDNLKLVVGQGTHGFSNTLRKAAVDWFLRHLKNGKPFSDTNHHGIKTDDKNTNDTNIDDTDTKDRKKEPVAEEPETLQCTKSGNVFTEFDDAIGINELNLRYLEKNRYTPVTDVREVKKRIRAVLNMPSAQNVIHPRFTAIKTIGNRRHQNVYFFSEEDIMVDGVYIDRPDKSPAGLCTLLLPENGTDDIPGMELLMDRLSGEGEIFVFDPRGVGACKSRDLTRAGYSMMFGTEHKLNNTANMMEMSLFGMRVFDVLRAIAVLKEYKPGREIALAGCGLGALYGVFAMALSDEIHTVYLENLLPSFESLVKNRTYPYHPVYDVFGMLKQVDIPMILRAFASEKDIRCVNIPEISPDLVVDHYRSEA